MKVIINIDNDQIIALAALAGVKKEDKEEIKKYIAEHDEVTVEESLFGDEDSQEVVIAIGAIAFAQIGKNIADERE